MTILPSPGGSAAWSWNYDIWWSNSRPSPTRWITFGGFHPTPQSHLGESLAFFLYDVPKVLLLLSLVVFVVGFLQSFISPTRVRDVLKLEPMDELEAERIRFPP